MKNKKWHSFTRGLGPGNWMGISSVFVLTFLVALIVAFQVNHFDRELRRNEFGDVCDDLVSKVRTRLFSYAVMLRSSSSFLSASDSVTRSEWRDFHRADLLKKNLPAIQAIGFVRKIPESQLGAHILSVRNEGFPQYNIIPDSKRELYCPVVFVEPFTPVNQKVFGFDPFTEPSRQKFMSIACDSDQVVFCDRLTLMQDVGFAPQPGTVFFAPVYRLNLPIGTVEQRRVALRGWVFCSIRYNDFVSDIVGDRVKKQTDLTLEIYDKPQAAPSALLYQSRKSGETNSGNGFVHLQSLRFNGQELFFVFHNSGPGFESFSGKAWIILILGLLVSLLSSVLTAGYISLKKRVVEVENLNDEMRGVNKRKDQFISILAHDLRNPMSAMVTLSELQVGEVSLIDNQNLKEQAGLIYTTSKQTYEMLDELLMWVKSANNRIPFNPAKTNLNSLYMSVMREMNPLFAAKGISCRLVADKTVSCEIDANMIKVVLRNLLTNATKFSHRGGTIELTLTTSGHEFVTAVSDNGVGMNQSVRENLFKSEQMNTAPGTDGEKGTGFGLLLCKEFVERHKGRIWVESEAGKGSRFLFAVPVSR